MLKIILLIVFCILAIVSYVFCKKTKDTPILSIIMAGISVILLIAVIFTGHLIKVDKEKEANTPVINDVIDDKNDLSPQNMENGYNTTVEEKNSMIIESDDEGNSDNSDKQDKKNTNKEDAEPLEDHTDKTNNDSKPVGAVSRD
ncbi:MAG: hypothetical protein IJE43_00860 [Alphaproteobacteria bacterium]|nr:hypothetical protein [Alphaproteobacteria bacterium]